MPENFEVYWQHLAADALHGYLMHETEGKMGCGAVRRRITIASKINTFLVYVQSANGLQQRKGYPYCPS